MEIVTLVAVVASVLLVTIPLHKSVVRLKNESDVMEIVIFMAVSRSTALGTHVAQLLLPSKSVLNFYENGVG